MAGCEGADDEGGVGPGDWVFGRFGAERVVVVWEVGGDGFGGGGCCGGDVVVVVDGVRVDLVEDHCWGVG